MLRTAAHRAERWRAVAHPRRFAPNPGATLSRGVHDSVDENPQFSLGVPSFYCPLWVIYCLLARGVTRLNLIEKHAFAPFAPFFDGRAVASHANARDRKMITKIWFTEILQMKGSRQRRGAAGNRREGDERLEDSGGGTQGAEGSERPKDDTKHTVPSVQCRAQIPRYAVPIDRKVAVDWPTSADLLQILARLLQILATAFRGDVHYAKDAFCPGIRAI